MDLTVSYLNKRLAGLLPADLATERVYVRGRVQLPPAPAERNGQASGNKDGRQPALAQFDLIEGARRIRCVLSRPGLHQGDLATGDMARAGGTLLFASHSAQYYLHVQELELLTTPATAAPPGTARATEAAPALFKLAVARDSRTSEPAELPRWLQQVTPPEIREQLSRGQADVAGVEAEPPLRGALNPQQLDYLTQAMDSPDDVELTAAELSRLAAESQAAAPAPDLPTSQAIPAPLVEQPLPAGSSANGVLELLRPRDWLDAVLIFGFGILALVAILASLVLLLG